MALIKPYEGKTPQLGNEVYLSENATLIGDIIIGNQSSVWFQSVLRGDVGSIRIGERTNIQDLSMVHCTYGHSATRIGNDVTVGHGAIVHGCEIHDLVLIGMGAIVMDLAVVETKVVVAAGSVVLEGMRLESGWLYAGIPAKKIKPLSEDHIQNLHYSADHYVQRGKSYRTGESFSLGS
ncbi:MAG: gamma carbonic anhydrase family protein [Bacteroidia bacterium]|nr:gamma carbonic anhydrase family protein [Bacteroidia bacterium]